MKYLEFEALVESQFNKIKNVCPSYRLGQHWINVLFNVNRKLHEAVLSSEADPFYSDDKLTKARELIHPLWVE